MSGDSTTIARPYAEAAFEVAKAHNAIDAWSDALNGLALIVADPQIEAQFGNPSVPRDELRDLIFGVAGDGLPVEVQNLVRLLADNQRLPVLPDLARLFEARKTAEEGQRHVRVTSAFALDADDQAALTATLKRHFGAEVDLTVEDDPALIGGVIIRAGDMVIDGSIRGRLEQLANELQF